MKNKQEIDLRNNKSKILAKQENKYGGGKQGLCKEMQEKNCEEN